MLYFSAELIFTNIGKPLTKKVIVTDNDGTILDITDKSKGNNLRNFVLGFLVINQEMNKKSIPNKYGELLLLLLIVSNT